MRIIGSHKLKKNYKNKNNKPTKIKIINLETKED